MANEIFVFLGGGGGWNHDIFRGYDLINQIFNHNEDNSSAEQDNVARLSSLSALNGNRSVYESIMIWTKFIKCGRFCSNRSMLVNSNCNNVGHQQMAKFLLSILFSELFSVILNGGKSKKKKL